MTRLARRADGTALVGTSDGFVPLSAVEPSIETWTGALQQATEGFPSLESATASPTPAAHLTFGTPLPEPKTLWGIGLNYAEHAADLHEDRPDEPASFMKPPTAAVGPGGPIRLPPESQSQRVTAEGELAVVIGRTAKDVTVEEAEDVIAGYLPVIDMTAEDILERNPRFLTRAKSFDTFLVLGPWMVTTDEVADLDSVTVRTIVNDTVEAENQVANMLFDPAELVAFHSRVKTLEPGDLISTGTPGAHPITPGDEVRATVEGVGDVTAPVVGADSDV